jgi:hypothetical protein
VIEKRSLSPARNENLVRWPPKDYDFKAKSHDGSNCKEGKTDTPFIELFPELSHWSYDSFSKAWWEYAHGATGQNPKSATYFF